MAHCDYSNQEKYPFSLPNLPFDKKEFSACFSQETFEYHHEKHHNAYVVNLNKLLENNSDYRVMELEEIISKSYGKEPGIFNNAAQVWNHSFFWHSIKPNGGGKPDGNLAEAINKDFGSFEKFLDEFKNAALTQFGSGWAWLVYSRKAEKLQIVKTANADTPLTEGLLPLIACDVWEHAYYIDYRNKRPDYVSVFLEKMINWDFAEMHFNRACR